MSLTHGNSLEPLGTRVRVPWRYRQACLVAPPPASASTASTGQRTLSTRKQRWMKSPRATTCWCTASVPGARVHAAADRLISGETQPVSGHDWVVTCEPATAQTRLWELSLPVSPRSGAPATVGDSDAAFHPLCSFAGSSPHSPS